MAKGNTNPVPGRLTRRARKADGDIEALRTIIWRYIKKLDDHLRRTEGVDEFCIKVGNGLSVAAQAYMRLVEVGELDARLGLLESAQCHTAAD